MQVRFAFAGFRHGHIFSLLSDVRRDERTMVVAACEEDDQTRAKLKAEGKVQITHCDYETMLAEVDCDVVAIGDFYGRRGNMAIRALENGRHVILDKPICTRLEELARMAALSAEKCLSVGCMLTMRHSAPLATMRKLIQAGDIGEVQTISFSGQHPRMFESRPKWYFTPGCHGGTINDIGIHALDAIGWLTGREVAEIVAARVWNRRTRAAPFFNDGAQMMLRLDNDGGVLGDVSYLAPDACGYRLPQYWRFTCHGTNGVVETPGSDGHILLATNDDKQPQQIPVEPGPERTYFHDFLRELAGERVQDGLSTASVLRASRLTLLVQEAADRNLRNVDCRA